MEDIQQILFLLLGMWLFVTRRQALFEQRLQGKTQLKKRTSQHSNLIKYAEL